MTGFTATFNAFNEDTHIDIGDYKVSLPQVTNTLADVIATGLTAPTTQVWLYFIWCKTFSTYRPHRCVDRFRPKN